MVTGHMSELKTAGDIANGKYFLVGCPHPGIHVDALRRINNTGLIQIKAVDIGSATGGHQQVTAVQRCLLVIRAKNNTHPGGRFLNPHHFNAFVQINSVFNDLRTHHVDQIRVILGHDFKHLENADFRTQMPVRLCHFDANRPATDDDQVFRNVRKTENRLVDQVGNVVNARNGRHKGAAAGRNNNAARMDMRIPGDHILRPGQFAFRLDHLHAQPFKPLNRIIGFDGGNGLAHMSVNPGRIDPGQVSANSEPRAFTHRLGRMPSRQQGFRRHASIVQAVAAHFVFFDQYGAGPHLGGPGSDRQAAGTGADNAQIDI